MRPARAGSAEINATNVRKAGLDAFMSDVLSRIVGSVFRIFEPGPYYMKPDWPADRYTLEPKVAFINQSFGVTAFSEARTSIGIEWKLLNNRGELVWVETIQGEGLGTPGNMFTGKERQKERFQLALQDLFQKSQKAMLNSQVLRKLP
jgi:hypothetical protein